MSSLSSRLSSEVNKNEVEFLLSELDLAMAFMDYASATTNEETAQRNHQNARKAYDVVVRQLPKVRLDHSQRRTIEEKFAELRSRLGGVGYQV